MKLLYLYIKDFHIFKDQEINFDSNYRFHLTRSFDGEPILNCEHFEVLDDNFFSTLSHEGTDRTPVECVSAVIGKNGSGKTSLCQFLHFLLLNTNEPQEHIIVYQHQDRDYDTESQNRKTVIKCQYHLLKSHTHPHLDSTGNEGIREKLKISGLNVAPISIDIDFVS